VQATPHVYNTLGRALHYSVSEVGISAENMY